MPVDEIRKKIGLVELAIQDAGATAAFNAIVETLKLIAEALERLPAPLDPK